MKFTVKKTLSVHAALAVALALGACSDKPTTAVLFNDYPTVPTDAPNRATIYKAWWATTLFADPVAPGASSAVERSVPGDDYAYVLLAPGWSADSGGSPRKLVVLRSAAKLSVAAHEQLTIAVSDDSFGGNCADGKPLDAQTAQDIVGSIFPGPFAGRIYDPATCTTTEGAADGGMPGDAHADDSVAAPGDGGGAADAGNLAETTEDATALD